jgi:membrane-associated protease RseP (regulator of RpoE activity)
VEYDSRLQPTADLGADSFGFPSLETYMAVVITGHLVIHFQSILLFPLAAAIVGVVGISRLYTKSRFPHQIIGSCLLGTIGLFLGLHLCEKSDIHRFKMIIFSGISVKMH